MKKVFSLFFFSVLGLFLFMGQKSINKPEKWNIDPQQTGIYDPNVISTAPLPQEYDYFNPNNTTRYISSPSGVYAVNPNFRILPRAGSYQSEVIICRHPLNPLIMFGSSNAINNTGTLFISEGVYVTTNGGVNWFGSDTLQGAPIGNHGGDPGPTIDKNGVIIMSHLGYSTSGMFAHYSSTTAQRGLQLILLLQVHRIKILPQQMTLRQVLITEGRMWSGLYSQSAILR